ncbi:hypothetical protein RQP46_002125 [Phenoliferia psychrophenolica]
MASDDRDGLDPVLAILKKEMAENPEISKALGDIDVMNATEEDLKNLMTPMQDMASFGRGSHRGGLRS